MKISNSAYSFLLLLPLLTLVPNPSFSPIDSQTTESNVTDDFSGIQKSLEDDNMIRDDGDNDGYSTCDDPILLV